MSKIYYEKIKQDDYELFGTLNSYLNRLFNNEEKNKEEISNMDINMMQEETKVILYSLLKQREIFDYIINKYPNLKELKKVKPLKNPIKLVEKPFNVFKEYKNMNILY